MELIIFIILFFSIKNGLFVSSRCPDYEFDYIVVGAGSTGSIVAARLSENQAATVLILEAGGEPTEKSTIPLLALSALQSEMDWNFTSTKQKHCCNLFFGKQLKLFRGKALGGTGSINTMAHTRGNRKDYDRWAEKGNKGWSYKQVFPYFLKIEDYQVPHPPELDKYHSTGGPMIVSLPPFKSPMADAFLAAGKEIGEPLVDYNAATQTGFMFPPVNLNLKTGARESTYTQYLKPAMKRPNLKVLTHALVSKVLVDKSTKQATGVEYIKNSEKCIAKAKKEVIVSGGTYKSPHILLLSGIGPKKTLQKFGIPPIVDLPGVGQNLQDHAFVGGQMFTMKKKVTLNSIRYHTKKYLNEWRAKGTGPMTVPGAYEGIAYHQSKLMKNVTDYPDIEIYFNSDTLITIVEKYINPLFPLFLPKRCKDVVTFSPVILRPKSRGEVTLKSKNPEAHPVINPNYLSHKDDVATLVEAMKFARRLGNTKAFRKYGSELSMGGFLPDCAIYILWSEEYYKCVVKVLLINLNHPTSTCRMGPKTDHMAVVDDRLRVHGIPNLRVADASIMPNIVSAHPNAACMMIGEKVSDMIKEDDK